MANFEVMKQVTRYPGRACIHLTPPPQYPSVDSIQVPTNPMTRAVLKIFPGQIKLLLGIIWQMDLYMLATYCYWVWDSFGYNSEEPGCFVLFIRISILAAWTHGYLDSYRKCSADIHVAPPPTPPWLAMPEFFLPIGQNVGRSDRRSLDQRVSWSDGRLIGWSVGNASCQLGRCWEDTQTDRA